MRLLVTHIIPPLFISSLPFCIFSRTQQWHSHTFSNQWLDLRDEWSALPCRGSKVPHALYQRHILCTCRQRGFYKDCMHNVSALHVRAGVALTCRRSLLHAICSAFKWPWCKTLLTTFLILFKTFISLIFPICLLCKTSIFVTSCHAYSHHVLSCHAIPRLVLPCHTLPYRNIFRSLLLYHVNPRRLS